MDAITTIPPRAAARDTTVLTTYFPVPLFGIAPINAFVIGAAEPVLVDTGIFPAREEFLRGLRSVIDLADLRWIWLTHQDADHVGSVDAILTEAPNARVVTTFVGWGKYNLRTFLPPDRVFLLNPGQRLDVGDRKLLAFRPPTYDAPETTGLFDEKTGVLFSSDCFGGFMKEPFEDASKIAPQALREANLFWARFDVPWLSMVQDAPFDRALDDVLDLRPEVVLSTHLPPACGMIGVLVDNVRAAKGAEPFIGPDDASFRAAMVGPPAEPRAAA